MDTTEVTTMTTTERTVTDNNNILTTQSSAESQSTSMTTLRADKKLTINSTCENTNECSGKLLCIDGICQCCKQFVWNGTICVKKKEMGKTCTDSVECQDDLNCINSRCSCNRSTYWNGIRCARKLPSECEDISSDKDGVYLVYPKGKITSRKIFVYCIMSGNKKWTVIQKRTDGSMDFYRTWSEYSNGFGRVDKDHWLGDGMDYHNSKSFYTKDRDNKNGCAVNRHGGWWYDNCYLANLNGRYNGTINESGKYTGLVWCKWKRDYSLKATLMMIRRK
ncbi:Hypothetical predicted protein [Mytilus galloprovincialis]|uniref:Fibrinogen C-terminal domain-containing protein n=1 Tax=Mytilus galloprovincialis TaxID=29158 RepID=A0A8B6BKE2_MYTGA|nr:Hypothetical predicted protein [Mytilus galloprovincialis]